MLHKPIKVENIIVNSREINDIKGESESLFGICVKSKILKNILN